MLNVESGLNDGIATPIVLVAIAGVAADEGIAGVDSPSRAVLTLLVGVLAGAAVGGLGGSDPAGPRPGLALRGACRPRCPGPGAARLHRGLAGRRQRLRRRLCRRSGLRRGRGTRWREGDLLRGAVRRHGLDDQLADLRRPRGAHDRRLVDSGAAGLRGPEPHRRADAARRPRPGRRRASIDSVSRSSAGSAPAAWRQSSSRCWHWRTCTTRARSSSPSSRSPSCSASSPTASAPGRSRKVHRINRPQPGTRGL